MIGYLDTIWNFVREFAIAWILGLYFIRVVFEYFIRRPIIRGKHRIQIIGRIGVELGYLSLAVMIATMNKSLSLSESAPLIFGLTGWSFSYLSYGRFYTYTEAVEAFGIIDIFRCAWYATPSVIIGVLMFYLTFAAI